MKLLNNNIIIGRLVYVGLKSFVVFQKSNSEFTRIKHPLELTI